MGILLLVLFITLMAIGVPIAFVIGIVALLGITGMPYTPEATVPMKMVNGLDSFVLLAVPLFILAANLMNSGKISEKLINLALAIVGPIRGGLAHANILVSMMFAGVSGASQADAAGVGKILIPSMKKQGYDKETAVGVTAASSTVGVIIPPSIPMIIFAGLTNASIGALFLGGIIPGILIGLGMMVLVYIIAMKRNFPKVARPKWSELGKLILESVPALLTPFIIIGGIILGFFTATEAAAIASLYTFLISIFFYKTLKLKDLPKILFDTLALSSLSLFALAAASALGELMSYYQLGTIAQEFFTNNVSAKWLFILIIIAFFLFVGTFMDAIPAMILFVPIILPTALEFGIDPVHLGLIVIITLAIGLATPPYGLVLLLSAKIGELSIERSFVAVLPYLFIIMAILLLIAFLPNIALFIPNLFN
ncbi:membrane protein [Virgibacillus pantothenticus]|uniref:C4-dicarboxylate ABC transporter permease n=1 Tax=Virgibacillus pantothenticus TaxID=1473 RepID=A0A0L0QT70_VIRPA|nr:MULTISPECIES: TRAP transporter large permease [Virgibacillus]API91996.1 C4-dicarboxylate ABC transporter permease [Virgibacillus sp. 6R]KNE21373.1 C4-dicarboxylate ABC transporter permease [Virgibacillus pantothenticus]MBS7430454.1 TRAP transporter large permease [Virgibacillus sp. 19R1-5]MBU8566392.1 TRAP transporter large permease [Virgibacillus pantothenticus]MBU8600192.1 TRAP transporter large permease [Virgibacillus pantothenticus]